MSVRLTLRVRPEQQYVIDCSAKGLESFTITLQLADDVGGGGNATVLESNGAGVQQDHVVNAIGMANAGYSVKGQEGCAVIDRKRYALGALGLGNQLQNSVDGLNTYNPAAA